MTPIHPFDLQARAELAAHSLTALLDQERDGLMYFLADWQAQPPRADHCLWDYGDGSGRHIDALTLVRLMLRPGSPAITRDAGERQIEDVMLRYIGNEGLTWLPDEPWSQPWEPGHMLIDWEGGEPLAEISWAQRGTLMGLISRYLQSSDERYLTFAKGMIDGLLQVAKREPDGVFYPEGYFRPSGWRYHRSNLHPCLEEYNAAVALPAIRLYEVTGYEPALELADGLVHFALRHTEGYLPNGGFRSSVDNIESHFHTRSNFVLSVLKLGLVQHQREHIAWARQSYAQLTCWGTDFGWFPEGLGMRHGEICCTTDMIELALLLGMHVDPRYFGDAERFGRNHLLESQFLSAERMDEALQRLPSEPKTGPNEGRYSTTENVAGSQVGGFASRSTLNDQFHTDAAQMMQCCNGAGTRALYDLWRYAAVKSRPEDGGPAHLSVNLRFSVETPDIRVVSHEPAEGRLDIQAGENAEVGVRLPEGTRQALLVRHSDGSSQVSTPEIRGGYASFTACAGERVQVHYPLIEREVQYMVGDSNRRLHCVGFWRGGTLMRIDPPGTFYPIYERTVDLPPVEPTLPATDLIESL